MLGKALHWIADEANNYHKVMHADFLKARYVISFESNEFWVHCLVETEKPIKRGPFPDPWKAQQHAERWCVQAISLANEMP